MRLFVLCQSSAKTRGSCPVEKIRKSDKQTKFANNNRNNSKVLQKPDLCTK